MLVWQLAVLAITSIVFHLCLLTLGLLALSDARIRKGVLEKSRLNQR